MSGFGLPGSLGSVAAVGIAATASGGTALVTSATANAKGAYVTLIASTAGDADSLLIALSKSGASDYLVDIAIGAAGAETVIVPDLYVGNGTQIYQTAYYPFPVSLPAGTRLSARAQASSGLSVCEVAAYLLKGNFARPGAYGKVVAYGTASADSGGTSVEPGAVLNTKGVYSTLISSTNEILRGFVLAFGGNNDTSRTTCSWLMDLAIGGSGSEKIILPDFLLACNSNADALMPPVSPFMEFDIPAGTRISARAQCSITTSGDRLFDVFLYGVS